MSAHLDTDALADVLAGLGQPDHLDGCEGCQRELAALSAALPSVARALTQLPDPEIPAELSDRISAALAAVSGAVSGSEAAPAPHAVEPPQPPAPVPAPLPAAASSTMTPVDVRRSGVPAWTKAAGALATAAALVVGAVLVLNSGSSHPSSTSASKAAASDIARNDTGTAYTKATTSLTAVLPQLLKGNAAPQVATGRAGPTAATLTSAVDELAPLRGKDGLAACLSSLSDPTDPGVPLALDYGTFDGKPALLVLLPAAKPGSVLAFFVAPGCNATDSHLLYYEKVPSP